MTWTYSKYNPPSYLILLLAGPFHGGASARLPRLAVDHGARDVSVRAAGHLQEIYAGRFKMYARCKMHSKRKEESQTH